MHPQASLEDVYSGPGAEIAGRVSATDRLPSGITGFIAVLTLLFGASGLFRNLRPALDRIYGDEESEMSHGQIIKHHLKPFLMVLVWGLTVFFLILVNSFFWGFSKHLPRYYTTVYSHMIGFGPIFMSVSILFFFIIRILPKRNISKKNAFYGALTGAALFTLGNIALNQTLKRTDILSVYGGASAILSLLIWSYYSANAFLFGALIAGMNEKEDEKPFIP